MYAEKLVNKARYELFHDEPVCRTLHELFHKVWTTGRVPHRVERWHHCVTLYKGKGTLNQFTSYRPISLLSVSGKVLAHVLLKTQRSEQSGFTRRRSTIDAILALRLSSDLHREFGIPLIAAHIDIKSAFDSVYRETLVQAMRCIGVTRFLLILIEDIHTVTT